GCSTLGRTVYERPDLIVPEQWASVSASADAPTSIAVNESPVAGAWWRDFNDEVLNRLVDLALERNNDLFSADLRVRRAQLQAALASNALVPSPSASTQGSWSRSLEEAGTTRRSQSASLSISYELDIWN